jgi:surface antigen
MRGAAVTDFSDSDWELLKATAQDVLNNRPDREQVNWSNPDTGNRGSLIVLATFTHNNQVCRRTAMRNLTFRGRDEKAAYSLCQQEDGTWQFVAESTLLAEEATSPD